MLVKIPNSLSADEVAVGYNAYSILNTGRDEFGGKLPLSFRSFDDYKNPLYIYSLVPFIKVFGLTEATVRLPSVLAGTLVVLLSFLLAKTLTGKNRLSLLVSFFAAVSPWLIQYSRVGIEMEYALFLTLLGVWLFLKKRILSVLVLGLSFYSYHSSKLWLVLFLPILIFFNKYFGMKMIISLFIFGLMLLPYAANFSNAAFRPYTVSVFSDQEQIYNDAKSIVADKSEGIIGGGLFHNRRFTYFNQMTNGLLHIMSPDILFAQSKYNQISSTRLFYLWQLPLLILGIAAIIKKRSLAVFLICWLMIGLLPGGLTNMPGFDRRILLASFPLIFLVAFGAVSFLKNKLFQMLTLILFLASFSFYLHNYFIHGQKEVVYIWGAGMKDVVLATETVKDQYKKVYISVYLNQPLTYFLFYDRYDPIKYLASGGTQNGAHFSEEERLESYTFKIIGPGDLAAGNLYVWEASESQPCLSKIKEIKDSSDKPVAYLGVYNCL